MLRYTKQLALATLLLCSGAVAATAGTHVVVNAKNPAGELGTQELRDLFLKARPSWSHGEKVRPVDLGMDYPSREAFLEAVLGMSAGELERHWIEKQYASGQAAPKKVDDESDVLRFVGAFAGGIGFVSSEALAADSSGKVRSILELP